MKATSGAASAPTPSDDKKAEATTLEQLEKEVATLQSATVAILKTLDEKIPHLTIKSVLRHVEKPTEITPFRETILLLPLMETQPLSKYTDKNPAPIDAKTWTEHYATIGKNVRAIDALQDKYIKLKYTITVDELKAQTIATTARILEEVRNLGDTAEIEKLLKSLKSQQEHVRTEVPKKAITDANKTNLILANWDRIYHLQISSFAVSHTPAKSNDITLQDAIIETEKKLGQLNHQKLLTLKDQPYTKLHYARVDIYTKLEKFKGELLTKIKKIYTDEKPPIQIPKDLDDKLNTLVEQKGALNNANCYSNFTEGFRQRNNNAQLTTELETTIKKYVITCNLMQTINPAAQLPSDMNALQTCMLKLSGTLESFTENESEKYRTQWESDYKKRTLPPVPDNASTLLSTKGKLPDTGASLVKDIKKVLSNSTELLAIPAIEASIASYREHLNGDIKNILGVVNRVMGRTTATTNAMLETPMGTLIWAEKAGDKLLLVKAGLLQELAAIAGDSKNTADERIANITAFLKRVPAKPLEQKKFDDTEYSVEFTDAYWQGALDVRNKIQTLNVAQLLGLPRKNINKADYKTDSTEDSKGKEMLKKINAIILMTTYATNTDEKAYRAALKTGIVFYAPAPPASGTAATGTPEPAPVGIAAGGKEPAPDKKFNG